MNMKFVLLFIHYTFLNLMCLYALTVILIFSFLIKTKSTKLIIHIYNFFFKFKFNILTTPVNTVMTDDFFTNH